jgi:hypothetical protein
MHGSSNEIEKCMCPMMLVIPPKRVRRIHLVGNGPHHLATFCACRGSVARVIRIVLHRDMQECDVYIVDDGRSGAITASKKVACSAHPIAQENLGTPPLQ